MISGNGFLLNISGHILIITFQIAQLAPLESHFQHKKGVLTKTQTRIILSYLPATPVSLHVYRLRSRVQGAMDGITCKDAAVAPGLCLSLWTVPRDRNQNTDLTSGFGITTVLSRFQYSLKEYININLQLFEIFRLALLPDTLTAKY